MLLGGIPPGLAACKEASSPMCTSLLVQVHDLGTCRPAGERLRCPCKDCPVPAITTSLGPGPRSPDARLQRDPPATRGRCRHAASSAAAGRRGASRMRTRAGTRTRPERDRATAATAGRAEEARAGAGCRLELGVPGGRSPLAPARRQPRARSRPQPCTPCTSRPIRPPGWSSPCTATSSATASATSWWPAPRSSTCTASTATPRWGPGRPRILGLGLRPGARRLPGGHHSWEGGCLCLRVCFGDPWSTPDLTRPPAGSRSLGSGRHDSCHVCTCASLCICVCMCVLGDPWGTPSPARPPSGSWDLD